MPYLIPCGWKGEAGSFPYGSKCWTEGGGNGTRRYKVQRPKKPDWWGPTHEGGQKKKKQPMP